MPGPYLQGDLGPPINELGQPLHPQAPGLLQGLPTSPQEIEAYKAMLRRKALIDQETFRRWQQRNALGGQVDTDHGQLEMPTLPPHVPAMPGGAINVEADQILRLEHDWMPRIEAGKAADAERAAAKAKERLSPADRKAVEDMERTRTQTLEGLGEDDRLRAITRHRAALGLI